MEIREYDNYILVALNEDDDRHEFANKLLALHKENPRRMIVSLGDGNIDDLIKRVETDTLNNLEHDTFQTIAEFLPKHRSVTALCQGPGWRYPTQKITYRSKDPSKGVDGMPRKRGKGSYR